MGGRSSVVLSVWFAHAPCSAHMAIDHRLRCFSIANNVQNCLDGIGRYPSGMSTQQDSDADAARFSGKEDERLAEQAEYILRLEMQKRQFSYKELAEAMSRLNDGPTESVQALTNKVNRGRFSFAFFLRACRAMGVASVEIKDVPPKPPAALL